MKKYPEPKNRADWLLHEPLKPPRTVKYTEMTLEKRIRLRKIQERILKEGNITEEEFEKLKKKYPLPGEIEDE